jgi:NAD(P)H-dependent FMN reductase
LQRPKILVFAGSVRPGSYNVRLAALAVKELALMDIEPTRIALEDYPLPLYLGDMKAAVPENAVRLKRQFTAHHGVFIASPEHNATFPTVLKNAIDWIAHVRESGRDGVEPMLAAWRNRVFALGSAANETYGGARSLMALRQTMQLGFGALVIPEQICVPQASNAFADNGTLRDDKHAAQFKTVLTRLVTVAERMM